MYAVSKVLADLKPPLEKDTVAEHLLPWLNDLRLLQFAIDSTLSLPSCNIILEESRFVDKNKCHARNLSTG